MNSNYWGKESTEFKEKKKEVHNYKIGKKDLKKERKYFSTRTKLSLACKKDSKHTFMYEKKKKEE